MNAAAHNHSPRCCCDDDPELGGTGQCPGCPDHGELAPGIECPQCHQPIGRPHTDFCTLAPDRVWDGVGRCGFRDLTHPDTPACTSPPHPITEPHTWPQADDPRGPGQWLRYEGEHPRTDHRAAGGPWHHVDTCTRVYCGATPEDSEWPKP